MSRAPDKRERERVGGEGGKAWMERERWHPTVNASVPNCVSTQTHTYTRTCTKTHIKPASQSVNQSMSTWGTRLLPFISPQTSQHSSLSCTTVCWQCSTSYSYSTTVTSSMVTGVETVHVHSGSPVTLKLNLPVSICQCWCCQLGVFVVTADSQDSCSDVAE